MEQKKRKIPLRQCLGCNEHFSKSELLRVVRSPEGSVSLDFTGKRSGRGAYICKKKACLAKAHRNGRLQKNLQCEIPETVYAQMEAELASKE